jgi:multimeric flavodoxin WrbA
MARKHLLIVANTPSENTRILRDAVVRGAQSPDIEDVEVRVMDPLKAGPDDVLAAQGIVLGTTENLGYMSGALKDFFDRIYYPCLERTQGLPYALYICQSASNNQPASASNIQPFFWLQNPLSRESTGGTRARRGVPVMADVAARVGGTCGPPWARHGRKEGQERFLNRQLSFPVSRISQ